MSLDTRNASRHHQAKRRRDVGGSGKKSVWRPWYRECNNSRPASLEKAIMKAELATDSELLRSLCKGLDRPSRWPTRVDWQVLCAFRIVSSLDLPTYQDDRFAGRSRSTRSVTSRATATAPSTSLSAPPLISAKVISTSSLRPLLCSARVSVGLP